MTKKNSSGKYYKKISLGIDMDGKYYLHEFNLPHEREDQGEYLLFNAEANIYQESDSNVWKRKILNSRIESMKEEIKEMQSRIEQLEILKQEIIAETLAVISEDLT